MNTPLDDYIITQLFGENPADYKRFGYPGHNGIDLTTSHQPPLVYCVHPGRVEQVGWEANGYGKFVVALHSTPITWRSYYAHLESVACKPGDWLKPGGVLGLMGSTGNSSGPHLHFGMKFPAAFNPAYRGFINPLPYLQGTPVAALQRPEDLSPTPAPSPPVGQGSPVPKSSPKITIPILIRVGVYGRKTLYRMKKWY